MVGFFFFSSRRRHTRYIGDWSSDVCSSDLTVGQQLKQEGYQGCWVLALGTNETADVYVGSPVGLAARIRRSEERRVGKERRSRGRTEHYKKKRKSNEKNVWEESRENRDLGS